jgi:transposase InsO family protein
MQAELISGLRRPRYRRPHRSSDDLPDLVRRAFTAAGPNRLWMVDVTQIPTEEGWVFMAAVLDAFSRALVGWAFGETNDTDLAAAALEMAIRRRTPERGLIHHSDRGAPYMGIAYGAALEAAGIRRSVGAARCCWDNAAMESFFATLKKDRLYRRSEAYASRDQAITDTVRYIEGFYNTKRRHSTIGYLSPAEFEAGTAAA